MNPPKQRTFLQRGQSLWDPILNREGSPGLCGPPSDLEGTVCITLSIRSKRSTPQTPAASFTQSPGSTTAHGITHWAGHGPPAHHLHPFFRKGCQVQREGLTCPGHTGSHWHQTQSPQRGPTPRRGNLPRAGAAPGRPDPRPALFKPAHLLHILRRNA